jgi:hypothetical protein
MMRRLPARDAGGSEKQNVSATCNFCLTWNSLAYHGPEIESHVGFTTMVFDSGVDRRAWHSDGCVIVTLMFVWIYSN